MTVHFIGAGPGAADLITLRGRDLIVGCPVCLYAGSLVPIGIVAFAPKNARVIDTAPMNLDQIMAEIDQAHGRGETTGRAILVQLPDTPAKLDVLRLPVTVSDTELAYLEEAFWVEKPARLFRRLVGETLRGRGQALVIDNDDTPVLADVVLRGTLLDMDYDPRTSSVVVRFDAVRTEAGGRATSRRFEARESGVPARSEAVGPAINRAANQVAKDVADWLAE